MAKRSQWASVIKESEKRKRFFEKHGYQPRAVGFGEDYSYNRDLPTSPPTAYFLRRFASFWDALRALRANRPPQPEPENPETWAMVPFYVELADKLLVALGESRDNYEACEKALYEWCDSAFRAVGVGPDEPRTADHTDPRAKVAWEVSWWLQPLLVAYADPKKFFTEIAPQIDGNKSFDPVKLRTDSRFISHGCLAETLHTWGFGALLNPHVRAAFDAAALQPEQLSRILSQAEGREPYVEGPPPGKTKGVPKKRRVDNTATKAKVWSLADDYEAETGAPRGAVKVATQLVAQEEGLTPGGIRQRMKRAGKE